MESMFTGNPAGYWRRVALASLARSGAELADGLKDDRETALELGRAQHEIFAYSTRLRILSDMMESASVRIMVALCFREDAQALMEEAKATANGQEVGHG